MPSGGRNADHLAWYGTQRGGSYGFLQPGGKNTDHQAARDASRACGIRCGHDHRVHATLFTRDADGLRAFFRDVLGFTSVDAGGGWLIFALPPAELAAHPSDEDSRHELYLMCDDIEVTVGELTNKGVELTRPISDEGFGLMTALRLPGGGELGLYEPRHPTPHSPAG